MAEPAPLMLYASYRTERSDDGVQTENSTESAFGLGWYARTGF